MSNELAIGKTNFDRERTFKNKFFYLADGDNVYRILPPMHSLASSGKYAAFHQTHMMKTSEGKWVKFLSNEEVSWDGGKKSIVVADPINVKYEKNLEQYQALKERAEKGEVTKDQLKAYYDASVLPLQPERKYYVNAINTDNQVSVLALPTTVFKALDQAILKLRNESGIDATDVNTGLFFNIIRSGKGRNTAYTVQVKMDPVQNTETGEMMMKYKRLPLTPALLEQVKLHSRDLNDLFRSVDLESMNAIAAASSQERPELLKRMFSRPEKSPAPTVESSAPGVTGVKAVNRVNVGTEGLSVDGPDFTTLDDTSLAAADTSGSASSGDLSGMSEEEFNKLFLD